MENNPTLYTFNTSEFGEVRLVKIENKPHAVGTDVAKALGYKSPRDAVSAHCRDTVICRLPTRGGRQNVKCIPEKDIRCLIAKVSGQNRSMDTNARASAFEKWIFDEAVPKLQKKEAENKQTNDLVDNILNDPDFGIRLLQELKAERSKTSALEKENAALRPKAEFADAVSGSESTILISDLAKLLQQNGVKNIGQNRLFKILRNEGYLVSRSSLDHNMPTQKSMDLGLFHIRETVFQRPDGNTVIKKTPRVTGKGQMYFMQKFLKKD